MTSDLTPGLLPCPFCGCSALWRGNSVDCSDDDCAGYWSYEVTPEDAVAAWNTRHLDPATLALARLGAAVLGSRIEQRKALFDAADTTPGILDRVAELLANTEESGDE